MSNPAIIQANRLAIGYTSKMIAGPLHLELHGGQFICLLGPNGSGKSTLLRTLAALQPALGGELLLYGKNIARMKPAEIARIISLVLTDTVRSGNLDVFSLIALGRYPYTGWFGTLSDADKNIIRNAITAARVEEFTTRKFAELSDGEAQKVMLARALAQDTPLIMLDEPTAHVDLPSRIQLMQLLHRQCREAGKAILISTHELDLALQVADRIWLLGADGTLTTGAPEDLVLNGAFENAFNKEGVAFDRVTGSFSVHSSYRQVSVRLTGHGVHVMWTKRALQRAGYQVVNEPAALEVTVDEHKMCWMYLHHGVERKFDTIEGLLEGMDVMHITTGSQ